ncbi:hypothetical protein Tco_1173562 [Tanacetum coccineum]
MVVGSRCSDSDEYMKLQLWRAYSETVVESLLSAAEERSVIIKQRVKDNQKARILELKRRNYEDYCSDNLYAVSIKEDTAYPYPELHSASTKNDQYAVSRRNPSPYWITSHEIFWNIIIVEPTPRNPNTPY